MIYVCMFGPEPEREPLQLFDGTPEQLNLNAGGGKEWRAIDRSIKRVQDVPAFETLEPHPDFVSPDAC